MQRKLILPLLLTALISVVTACNHSDDTEYTYTESSSVNITAFSLTNDPKVLDSLSNVFFSIDLVNAKIFNADSLPYGTRVTSLIPRITAPTYASAVELSFYSTKAKRDSVVNYLTNSTDSIDFSNGPVKLTVTSQSGLTKRVYEISVNVHQVKSDTLAWYSIESAPLPTTFGAMTAQSTVCMGGTYYCLSTDGSAYCLATTANPADPQWQTQEFTLPFTARLYTLRASDSMLYMLDTDGHLYASANGSEWQQTDAVWHHIYGGYGDDIIGCTADKQQIVSYPAGHTWTRPETFPVEGTSLPAYYTVPMGFGQEMVMTGGRLANGTLTAYSWSFDGNDWMEVTTKPMPLALESPTLVPYDLLSLPSTTWAPRRYPALLAFGGRTVQGAINRTVYYSRDWGMTWSKAPDTVQLPDALPVSYGGNAYQYSTTMYVGSRSVGWTEIPLRALPPHCRFVTPSRAVAPVSQWECPAIYLFGGRDYDGNPINSLWRGVIREYTFVPVQ